MISFSFLNTLTLRQRLMLFVGTLGLLLFLCFMSYRSGIAQHQVQRYRLYHPNEHAGEPFAISYGRVKDVNERETTLQFKTCWVNVRPRIEGASLGQIISVHGIIAPDTSITLLKAHIHRGKWNKLYVSLVALVAFMIIFFKRYRWDFATWTFGEKHTDA